MAKYIDLGHKSEGPIEVGAKGKAKIHYQTISLTGDEIPSELGAAENESQCRLEIVVRKIGDSIDIYAKGEPRRVEIQLRKLAYLGKAGKASMKEFSNMTSKQREEYQDEEKGS